MSVSSSTVSHGSTYGLRGSNLAEQVSTVFGNDLDSSFYTQESPGDIEPLSGYEFISKEKLIEILNSIENQGPHGKDLLTALKEARPNNSGKKLLFITFVDNSDRDLMELNDDYGFKSEFTLRPNNETIYITIKNESPKSVDRFVFDGQKVVSYSIKPNNPESYFISHELAHVVSFLESGSKTLEEWNDRKDGWATFLQTDRMKPINDALLKKGLNQDKINSAFKNLFSNTEEVRNLLGFESNGGRFIGEYFFFNKESNFVLPTYLSKGKDLTPNEITVLKTIGENLGIQFQAQGGEVQPREFIDSCLLI